MLTELDFLTEGDLAARLKVSVRTLQAHRRRGAGIPYVKFGRCVRYDLADVAAYLDGNKRPADDVTPPEANPPPLSRGGGKFPRCGGAGR